MTEQIYQKIRSDIIRQNIKCGEKINFIKLKERFGVSHTPLREAFKRLMQEGLVEYFPNYGYQVIKIGKKDIADIIDLCSTLDCKAVKWAMERGNTDQLIADLKTHLDGHINCFLEKKQEEYFFHIDQFHRVFYKYADNSRLSRAARHCDCKISRSNGI
ncbi:GntR family transcriptional regulator [Brevibacillus sp. NRS-1366]|uniref:GntR family transcriptional regulator n=1 Tax=Brevibacillus sp. NRS-1366 TaxID=3233899 RepID=UPI003D1C52FF